MASGGTLYMKSVKTRQKITSIFLRWPYENMPLLTHQKIMDNTTNVLLQNKSVRVEQIHLYWVVFMMSSGCASMICDGEYYDHYHHTIFCDTQSNHIIHDWSNQVPIWHSVLCDGVWVWGKLWRICSTRPSSPWIPGTKGSHPVFHKVNLGHL